MKRIASLKRILSLVLLCSILALGIEHLDSHATTVNNAINEKNKTEQQIKDAEDEKKQLDSKVEEVENYVSNLNTNLSEISKSLNDINEQLIKKQSEIDNTQIELDNAIKKEQDQYEGMKLRIKHMYEKGSSSYVEILLESGSIVDLINRMEYVSRMSEYDKNLLSEYSAIKETIAQKSEQLEVEKQELSTLQAKTIEKQSEAQQLVTDASKELKKYSDKADEIKSAISDYEQKLKEQEEKIDKLKEQEENNSQIQVPAGPIPPINGADSAENATDLEMLAAIIECEAGGEGYEEMLGVGSVVMNRIHSTKYPNTMIEVLYQYKQFSPVESGRFAIVLARGAMDICVRAAEQTMGGYSNVGDCIGFKLASTGIQGIVIGKIVFFK